ncbi:MAG: D-Ala-D-Ala carboxypeptidase family metallohydrolase [Rhodospirillales bacterium]
MSSRRIAPKGLAAGFLFVICLMLAGIANAPRAFADAFTSARAPFGLTVDGVRIPFNLMAIFALPGGRLVIETGERARIEAETGKVITISPQRFGWEVPATTGPHAVRVVGRKGNIDLTVIVMRSMDEVRDGRIDGYMIGEYPEKPYKGLAAYERPAGLIEVTPEIADLPVSPHFRLGQFLCKQQSDWPKFMVLRTELLIKLERVLEEVNRRGWRTGSFHIMSGYRTPYYNRTIGNGENSRHVYGGAADIFIDVKPKDGVMDDIDRDGRITKKDALALYRLVESIVSDEPETWMPGGLGAYGATRSHGPFVHIDTRGYVARWGVAPL